MSDPGNLLRSYDPRPRGTAELLDAAFWVMRSDPKAIGLLVLAPYYLFSAMSWVVGDEPGAAAAIAILLGWIAGTALPGYALVVLWSGRLLGGRPSWRAACAEALRRAPAVLVATTAAGCVVLIGMAMLVLPGVYAALALFVPNEALAFERVGALRALARSRLLMVGSKRRVAIPVVALFVLTAANLLPFGSGLRAAATLVEAVAVAYLSALSFVTYVDARVRKEGFDLEVLAARVAARTGAIEGAAGRQALGSGGAP